ncbi:MAG: right-handed parallel beta-helix repeat-containing protein [Acidiferrobacteraceae bacterium]
MRLAPVLTLLVSLFMNPAAHARNDYVSPKGSDHHSGTLRAPWRTLAYAVRQARPGDHLWLEGGSYTGGVVIDRPGTAHHWITLSAYHGQKVVVVDARGHKDDLYFYCNGFKPLYWRVEGLDLVGGDDYVVKIDVPDVQLIGNDMHSSHDDIVKLVRTAANVVIERNRIHDNDARDGANAQGVDIVGARNVRVAYNRVYNIPSFGMFAKGNATHVVFAHNVLDHIYSRGIMLGQATGTQFMTPGRTYETYDSVIRDNVIEHTGGACVATASSWRPRIYDNFCRDVATRNTAGIFVSNESELHQAGTDVDIHNNVIILGGSRPAVEIAPNAMTSDRTLHINHNLYWSPKGAKGVRFSWVRGLGEDKPSFYFVPFSTWQRLTGLDRDSAVVSPTLAMEHHVLGSAVRLPSSGASLR